MNLEFFPCSFCGSDEYTIVFRGKDLMVDLPGQFQMVRCKSCGLLRQNPRLDWVDLQKHYPLNHGSYKPLLPNSSTRLTRIIARYGHWKRVNLVSKYVPSGEWLEVGIGSGLILQEALFRNKWNLKAIEPNRQIAGYVQDNLEIPVQPVLFEDYIAEEESFDLITMWDVLEHLPNPIGAIKKAHKLLRNNGFFIFQIPNYDSWNRIVFKATWGGYDLPRHLYLFPKKALYELLPRFGFKIIRETTVAGSHGAFILDLRFWLKMNNSMIVERIVEHGPDFLPFRFLTAIPFWITDKMGLGSNIIIITKKIVEY